MKKIKGPAHRPPTLEKIKSQSMEDIAEHSHPQRATVSAIPAQDVIDMTQPSQPYWVLARFEGLVLDSMSHEPAYREDIRVVV